MAAVSAPRRAVSYTHLDVYKRQHHTGEVVMHTTCKDGAEGDPQEHHGTPPVSYTHLDVYKRQVKGCQDLVRFFALRRIKPHTPLLVRAPVDVYKRQVHGTARALPW